MSLYDKYSKDSSDEIFVNFIENQFEVKDFKRLTAMEYTNKFVIEFKPTDNCNFNCSYCCFHDNSSKHLSDEQFANYLEVLKKMDTPKEEIFLFVYGGEPTMHPKLTEMIIAINQLYKDKKVRTLIQSNGIKWNSADYEKNHFLLKEHDIDYVFSFSFHKEFTNITEIVARINYLKMQGVFDVMTYMITRRDIDKHIRNIKIFESLGVPLYVRTILQESEWFLTSPYKKYISSTPDETPYILEDEKGTRPLSFEDLTMGGYLNFKGYKCSSGVDAILLASNGKIYRCDMDFLYDRNMMYDVNVSNEPLIDFTDDKCKVCDHKFCSIYYGDKWK